MRVLPLALLCLACAGAPPQPLEADIATLQPQANGLRVLIEPNAAVLDPNARGYARLTLPAGPAQEASQRRGEAALSLEILLGGAMEGQDQGLKARLNALGAKIEGQVEGDRCELTLIYLQQQQAAVFALLAQALEAPSGDIEAAKTRLKRRCAGLDLRQVARARLVRLIAPADPLTRPACAAEKDIDALSGARPFSPRGALLYIYGERTSATHAIAPLLAWSGAPMAVQKQGAPPAEAAQPQSAPQSEAMSGPLGLHLLLSRPIKTGPSALISWIELDLLAGLWRRQGFQAETLWLGSREALLLSLEGVEIEAALARIDDAPLRWRDADLGAVYGARLREESTPRFRAEVAWRWPPQAYFQALTQRVRLRSLRQAHWALLRGRSALILTTPDLKNLDAALWGERLDEQLGGLQAHAAQRTSPSTPPPALSELKFGEKTLAWRHTPSGEGAALSLLIDLGRVHEPQRLRGGLEVLAEALQSADLEVEILPEHTLLTLRGAPDTLELKLRALEHQLSPQIPLDLERARAQVRHRSTARRLDPRAWAVDLLNAVLEHERRADQLADLDEITPAHLYALRDALRQAPKRALLISPLAGLALIEPLRRLQGEVAITRAPRPEPFEPPHQHLIEAATGVWRAAYEIDGVAAERWAALSLTAALLEGETPTARIEAEVQGRRLFITVTAPTEKLDEGIVLARGRLAKIMQIGDDAARIEVIKARHLNVIRLAWTEAVTAARVLADWTRAGWDLRSFHEAAAQIAQLNRDDLKQIIGGLRFLGEIRLNRTPIQATQPPIARHISHLHGEIP
ncbi:hypothetical protein KKF91_11270 [Myxococcota bacterium]|nr:hypothetical protein [Myxococcota bacterium]MBU1431108.1 hypothetical protein [Myxococcota bacterium]MBU1897104.1 hypothetical protein [Myxococcota bacterium]